MPSGAPWHDAALLSLCCCCCCLESTKAAAQWPARFPKTVPNPFPFHTQQAQNPGRLQRRQLSAGGSCPPTPTSHLTNSVEPQQHSPPTVFRLPWPSPRQGLPAIQINLISFPASRASSGIRSQPLILAQLDSSGVMSSAGNAHARSSCPRTQPQHTTAEPYTTSHWLPCNPILADDDNLRTRYHHASTEPARVAGCREKACITIHSLSAGTLLQPLLGRCPPRSKAA